MISRFTIGNYLSFKDHSTLLFEATALKDQDENLFNLSSFNSRLIKSAAIYGANASGKSNFLRAFAFMKFWILNSFSESNRITEIPIKPYLLSKSMKDKPSMFEVVFYENGYKYRYGFEITGRSVEAEWLFYTEPRKREQNYFLRGGQEIQINNTWKRTLNKQLEPLTSYVRPRVLYISVLAQFNIDIGTLVVDWVNKNIVESDLGSDLSIKQTANLLSDPEFNIIIHQLINEAKLGFTSIRAVAADANGKKRFETDFVEFAKKSTLEELQLLTRHEMHEDDAQVTGETYFDLKEEESAGSRKFVALAAILIKSIRNNDIVWIDELDAKLHPFLFEAIINFFNSNRYNHKGAQLVFTTHNTHLLKKKSLRRDQIFTMNKSDLGNSYLKSIHSIEKSVRIDSSHEKVYITGKYGGVPNINPEGFQLDLF